MLSRWWLLAAVFASSALAAKPGFQDVVKKFKPATLPWSSKDVAVPKTGLLPEEIAALGFAKSTTSELKELRQWKAKPDEDETLTIWPIAQVARPGVTVLVVRFDQALPMSSTATTFLLTYGPKGELLDGLRFGATTSSEAGGGDDVATLAESGAITRSSTAKIPMMEEGLPEQLVVNSEAPAKLTASGKFEVSPEIFTTKDGAFIDRKSKEELRVFGEKVFYRANDTKPFQALLRDGDAVRFKKGGPPYLLSWDERMISVNCKNPGGSVQRFTREW